MGLSDTYWYFFGVSILGSGFIRFRSLGFSKPPYPLSTEANWKNTPRLVQDGQPSSVHRPTLVSPT